MIGSHDPDRLGAFYEKVIGKPSDMQEMEEWYGWMVGKTFLTIGPHSEIMGPSKEPQRVMFNFETRNVPKEYARLLKLGAVAVKEPYEIQGMGIATLADPDGNYFQLMTPWEDK